MEVSLSFLFLNIPTPDSSENYFDMCLLPSLKPQRGVQQLADFPS